MKLLKRNMTEFEYLPQTGEETDIDANGHHTGDFHPLYGTPVTYWGNISAPSGQVQHQFYGRDIRYTHTLLMDDPNVDIKEGGLIHWKGNTYDIKAAIPTLNVLSVALHRQTSIDTENGPEEEPEDETEPDEEDDTEPEGEEP